MRRELGRIHVQAAAVANEVYSGMFDEFPNLKFIHTMLGGNFFGLQQILAPHKSTKKKEAMNRLATNVDPESYQRYMQNNIFFDLTHPMSWGKAQLECAVKVCGADHLLLGSSFPVFYEWMARSVETIKSLFGGKSKNFITAVDEKSLIVVKELEEEETYEDVDCLSIHA